MGILGTLFTFGAGYAAGMRIGRHPVNEVRAATGAIRRGERPGEVLRGTAHDMRSAIGSTNGLGDPVDVREVREVMTSAPQTVRPSATLSDAASIMERNDIGDVLVVDEKDALQGIITDRDIAVRAVAKGLNPSATPVSEAFTHSVITITPTEPAQRAVDLMRRHDVRRLPVVESGHPVGIVSLGDLAIALDRASALADISAAPADS